MSSRTADDDRIGPQLTLEELAIPPHVGDHLATLHGRDERIATGAEWIAEMRAASERRRGEPPTEADLCHFEDGNHTVELDGETLSFVCVLDPFAVPFLRGEPGTVHSVTPEDGESITIDVEADGASVDADGAVVSLGVSRDPEAGDPVTNEDVYADTCPYIHVFESVDEYERWAADQNAATTSVPVETGVAVAREIVGELFG